ncbi:XRE family transcriptional regulator [Methylophaga thalassica]|uniref:helix-turn-helix domain-containing protein n=1 Tax=Methylophaga thalassica TaxID=40223 RepID=UPI002E7B0A86|nr:XRE family transcriptional regulator [Methylophaga thalassica]WVI84893.1 XRE family transcriptional regulator [Methylophaga thalassica]
MSKQQTIVTTEPATHQSLDKHLGNTLRHIRTENGLTIADVAMRANVSRGMLSKIENGLTSPSLEKLEHLANALGVKLSRLFHDYDTPIGGAQYVKNGEGMEVVRRGTKSGHTYQLLAYDTGPKKLFEPFLITLNEESEVFDPFEHAGTEFIYMLEGKLEYSVGDERFILEPGDSLTFHAEQPHRPETKLKMPIQYLAIIYYDSLDDFEDDSYNN